MRIPNGDTTQEVIKIVYQNEDVVFVSIHSLHKVSKYKGKEGEPPRLNKLGTGAWEKLKERTKSKIKDIARDLIKLRITSYNVCYTKLLRESFALMQYASEEEWATLSEEEVPADYPDIWKELDIAHSGTACHTRFTEDVRVAMIILMISIRGPMP